MGRVYNKIDPCFMMLLALLIWCITVLGVTVMCFIVAVLQSCPMSNAWARRIKEKKLMYKYVRNIDDDYESLAMHGWF